MSTVTSSSTAYATAADLTYRFDVNVVAQLVSDTGTRVAASALTSNTVLTKLLMVASGLVEAACLAGQRYSVADLTALSGTNGGELLIDIVCGLAFARLPRRREWAAAETPLEKDARELLTALAAGTRIFGLAEHAAAGVASHEIETAAQVDNRQQIDVLAERSFGRRSDRLGPQRAN